MLSFQIILPEYCHHLEVDLSLEVGAIHVMTGPSGSGKSLLMRALAGLEQFAGATIAFKGQVWQDDREHLPPYRRAMGYVRQMPLLFSHLRLQENLQYGGDLFQDPAYQALLESFGLESKLRQKVDHLSGGETQKAALLQALAAEPQVLLLDEPFNGLDWENKKRVMAALKRYVLDKKITVLLVTHSLEEMRFFGDSLIYLAAEEVRKISVSEIA